MEAKTAGGIYLPESSVKELNEARVLAVGPGGLDKDGKRVQCSVAPGDKVLIPQVSWDGICLFLRSWRSEREERLGARSVVNWRLLLTGCTVWWITGQGWR
jgi:hypothetical protein